MPSVCTWRPNRSRRSGFSFFSAFDERLDALRHLEPRRAARALAEIARHLAQVRRARIFGRIDTVSEPWNLLLAGELAAHQLVDPLGDRRLAELEEHPHDVGIGAAVQRSLERADGRNDWE